MRYLCIIQCARSKLEGKHPAIELYSKSSLFNKCLNIANTLGSDILIISAFHGFLFPTDEIEDYDFGGEQGPMMGSETQIERREREDNNNKKKEHFKSILLNNIIDKDIDFLQYDRIIMLVNQHFFKDVFEQIELFKDSNYWFVGSKGAFFLPQHLDNKLKEELLWQKNNLGGYNKKCVICCKIFVSKQQRRATCSIICNSMNWKNLFPEKRKESDKRYITKNKEKIYEYNENYTKNHKERHTETTLKWQKNNYERKKENDRRWVEKNPWYKKQCQLNSMEKYHNDPNYRLIVKMRSRMYKALSKKSAPKYVRTYDMIGCTPEFLHNYLKENYKLINNLSNDEEFYEFIKDKILHIDHIIPINTFNLLLEEEQRKGFHYTNLRFLEKYENLSRPKDGSDLPKHTVPIDTKVHN